MTSTGVVLIFVLAAGTFQCGMNTAARRQGRALAAACQCRCIFVPDPDERQVPWDATVHNAWGGGVWWCAR